MNHEYLFEVQGYELDSFGHVNNAVYLNYLEAARWKFVQETKWLDYLEKEKMFTAVIETNIRYLREMKLFDQGIVASLWQYDGNYLIVRQNIYLVPTRTKMVRAQVKMVLVSEERIIHELPSFMKDEMDQRATR